MDWTAVSASDPSPRSYSHLNRRGISAPAGRWP